MDEITLFILEDCPHCKLALAHQRELIAAHPEWDEIPIRVVDEAVEVGYANSFDYYYVPCYYVNGVKVHEGHAERADVERADVERVFRTAMGEYAPA